MGKRRTWVVEFRGRPQANGIERLGLAVKIVVDRGLEAQRRQHERVASEAAVVAGCGAAELEGEA